MPFKLSRRKLENFESELHQFFRGQTKFKLCLDGFGAFQPRVIFIDVQQNPELIALQRGLSKKLQKWHLSKSTKRNKGFVPHVTVAFRDLRRALFNQAWSEYAEKKFHAELLIDRACLLRHDGRRWAECTTIAF